MTPSIWNCMLPMQIVDQSISGNFKCSGQSFTSVLWTTRCSSSYFYLPTNKSFLTKCWSSSQKDLQTSAGISHASCKSSENVLATVAKPVYQFASALPSSSSGSAPSHVWTSEATATNPSSTICSTHGAQFRASKNMVGRT